MEGGWVQERRFDVGWSDESKCQACHEEAGTEQHRLHHCPGWYEIRREIQKPTENGNKKPTFQRESGNSKVEVAKFIVSLVT